MTRRLRASIAAVLAAGLLAGPLSACAPEPDDVAGSPEKGQNPDEKSWSEPETPFDPSVKSTDIPDDFPAEFPIPDDATVDDAGARSETEWFVVFRAADPEAADALWDAIVADGSFIVDDDAPTDDGGRTATLTGAGLSVFALTIPQEDGSVLLSYDLSSGDDSAE